MAGCGPFFIPQNQPHHRPIVGTGLLAKASAASTSMLTETPHSRASPLPQMHLLYSFRVLINSFLFLNEYKSRPYTRSGTDTTQESSPCATNQSAT
ncbi:hypothetical protein FE275_14125 [Pseudomonas koreensis]|nr:hypothetical protein FE275_14125 [Pseudomonas koreensis]